MAPDQVLDVTLFWQAKMPVGLDYTVFVQLLDTDGDVWGQHDAQPDDGQLPTSQWIVGEVVADPHSLIVAPDVPPGDYHLMVGLYCWDTGERLPVLGDTTGQDAVILTEISVQLR